MGADPHDKRDELARAYMRNLRRQGYAGEMPAEAIQRLAAEDRMLVERYDAEQKGKIRARRTKKETDFAPVEAMAAEVGGRFYTRRLTAEDDRIERETLDSVLLERRAKLVARIREIGRKDRLGQAVYPRLVEELAVIHANWTMAGLGKPMRHYRHAWTQQERDRIFFRQLEDLADRSNATIRPNWWVK